VLDQEVLEPKGANKMTGSLIKDLHRVMNETFTDKDTGMPFYNTFLNTSPVGREKNGKDYMEKNKGKRSQIIEIPPMVYLEATVQGFNVSSGENAGDIEKKIDNMRDSEQYAEVLQKMKDGTKFHMPVLEYDGSRDISFTQEGRNRALAAHDLEEETIPVLVVYPSDSQERLKVAKAIHHSVSTKLDNF